MPKPNLKRQAFERLCAELDKSDAFYAELQSFFDKHGNVPPEYELDWKTYLKDKRPWRKIPGTKFRLWQAAVKMAHNESLAQPQKSHAVV